MTHPSRAELDRLRIVAGEISETLEAEGHTVTKALNLNAAFKKGAGPASAMERALVKDAARRGASLAKLYPESTAGGGLDITSVDGNTMRTYRVKSATKRADGSHDIVCGAGSTLIHPEVSESLYAEERWIKGYTLTDDHLLDEIFVAPIVGHYGENPVHLELGEIISLTPTSPPLGFTSSDEDDLPGFEDDSDDEETGSD